MISNLEENDNSAINIYELNCDDPIGYIYEYI